MNATKRLSQVQVASAIYDYVAVGILAFPLLGGWHLGTTLLTAHEMLGSNGAYPVFEPLHLLIVNMFGGFTIMWSTLRILWRQPVLGLCDGLLRWYFAILMLYYILAWDCTQVLYGFVVMELLWGIVLVGLFLLHRSQESGQRQSGQLPSPAT